jgi:hypothetical protein
MKKSPSGTAREMFSQLIERKPFTVADAIISRSDEDLVERHCTEHRSTETPVSRGDQRTAYSRSNDAWAHTIHHVGQRHLAGGVHDDH